ncbi:MAG: aldose epimerase [Leptospiraceae bacterium]|nr:aldose epimerase [Leptospiraceae bacterium]
MQSRNDSEFGGLQLHRNALLAAIDRLREKAVAGNPEESISMRVPGRPEMLFAASDAEGTGLDGSVVELVSFSRPASVAGNPMDAPEGFMVSDQDFEAKALHAFLYRHRPDTGAIFLGKQQWASVLGRLGEVMPAVFDEQARQLGPSVCRYESWNETGFRKALRKGSNAFLFEDSVLLLGMTLDKAIFNAELLEKCARAFVLARLTGKRFKRIPWYVRMIANQRLRKDEKRSAESYAAGEIPGGFTAY